MLFKKKSVFFFSVFVFIIGSVFGENKLGKVEIAEASVPTSKSATTAVKLESKKLAYDAKDQIVFCINREEILEKCELVKDLRNGLDELNKKLYEEMKPLAQEFEEKQQAFQKKAKTMSREALAKEEQDMMQLAQEFQIKNMESQDLLKREEMRIIREFSQELSKACKEFLLRDENVHVVLIPTDYTMYVHGKYDATEKILEVMNNAYKVAKKALPKSDKKTGAKTTK